MFKKGRTNLSATIFVPYDCTNNCPFCTSKKVYINTTLPLNTLVDAIELINTNDKICGINVSRHINFSFPHVASIKDLDKINKCIRINSVLSNDMGLDCLPSFIKYYGKKKRDINIRADYRIITKRNLNKRNETVEYLAELYDYYSTESCLVCNTDYFSVNDEFLVSYHRGLELSSVRFGKKCYINDIIVKQDGSIYKDWDCKKDVNFEAWIFNATKVKIVPTEESSYGISDNINIIGKDGTILFYDVCKKDIERMLKENNYVSERKDD